MKSYLSLIPISAKVRRRQNRMTIFCIVLAVFLVTSVFSMADMGIRAEEKNLLNKHGKWHIQLMDIPESKAEQISLRSDIAAMAWYSVLNYDRKLDYYIGDRTAVICGVDQLYITDIRKCLEEGSYPMNDTEVILSPNAKNILGVKIGDKITVNTPAKDMEYIISGFGEDDTSFNTLYGTISVYMNKAAFQKICDLNQKKLTPTYYVQLKKDSGISRRIAEIKKQYNLTEENVKINKAILDISGINSSSVDSLYLVAVILFVLILVAGVLMIASSMNSNVAQRTQFFGMMRCIGMSKKQILRFVRLEALNWCRIAVPIGIILGILCTWGLCAYMRFGVGEEFIFMPLFEVSPIGIVSGAVTGIATVFIAAKSPAKQASKVSPVAAVSGNIGNAKEVYHAANTGFQKIETKLGVHHALSAKKNLGLMTGSFALSIILFLSFSVLIDLVNCLMPQRASAPDIEIYSKDNSNSLNYTLIDQIKKMEGVKEVFGRRTSFGVPAKSSNGTFSADTVDLISFDKFDLDCLKKDKELTKQSDISKVYGNSGYVLAINAEKGTYKIGDKIRIKDEELEVAGLLKYNIFSNDGKADHSITLITSGETFSRLTNITNYSLISIKVSKNATDGNVEAIRSLIADKGKFLDRRDQRTTGTYTAFVILVYSFVALIMLVAILNIVNSISMSVSARIKQYGIMCAVGMDKHQIAKMIAAEASTYAFAGCAVGFAIGLFISKLMYDKLITAHFPYVTWSIPIKSSFIILVYILASTILAIYAPIKRIHNLSITDTINQL